MQNYTITLFEFGIASVNFETYSYRIAFLRQRANSIIRIFTTTRDKIPFRRHYYVEFM